MLRHDMTKNRNARKVAARTGMLVAVGLAFLTGCSSLSSRSVAYIAAPRFGPTDATGIEILQAEPSRAHDKLGEVVVNASVDPAPPVDQIEARLRREAGRLGADAVYLVHDRTEAVGGVVMGPWWSQSYSTIQGRIVVGVAIKYK
jgi:hypothetical protein